MSHVVRQSGFYLVVLYCITRLYEMLWARTTFSFMLEIVMAASACYIGMRLWLLYRQGLRLTSGEKGVAVLLLLLGVAIACQYAFVGSINDMADIDTFTYTVNMLVTNLFWLFAGASMAMCHLGHSVTRTVVLMSAMAVIVASATDEGSLFVNYWQIAQDAGLEKFSHLNVAEFAVVLILICYASVQRLRVVVFFVGVAVLFALGGRSSLYFTILSVGAFEALQRGVSFRAIRALVGLSATLVLLFYLALHFELLDQDSRFVQQMLFTEGMEEDASFEQRQEIALDAPKYLPAQMMFGDPTLIVSNFGYIGSYLHNLLSAWQFFGLPTFLTMVALLWASWRRMREALRNEPSPLIEFGALLLIYTIISVVMSKFVGFRFLWVSIGFWMLKPDLADLRAPVQRRRKRKRRRRSKGLLHGLRGRVGA